MKLDLWERIVGAALFSLAFEAGCAVNGCANEVARAEPNALVAVIDAVGALVCSAAFWWTYSREKRGGSR